MGLRDRMSALRSNVSSVLASSSASVPLETKSNALSSFSYPSERPPAYSEKSTAIFPNTVASPDQACIHKHAIGCQLATIRCCACLDKRPRAYTYAQYEDGVGNVVNAPRWQGYCPNCSAHWKHRARRGNRLEGPLTNAGQLNHIYLHVSLSRAGHTCNLDITTSEPAALTIGELRAQAGRMLDVRDPALDIVDPSRLRLYLRGEELSDVSMSVEGAGLRFDGRNDLWYTVDQRDFGAQMMDNLDPLGREVETLEKRLADMESAGEGKPTDQLLLRTCIICTEAHPTTAFPALPPTARCTHLSQVCSRDLDQWLLVELSAKGPSRISCPECGTLLVHADFVRLDSPTTLSAFETAMTREVLRHDPDFRWCLNPVACGSGQLHSTGRDGPIMTCFECHFRQCAVHERAWHEGETCAAYDARIATIAVDPATTRLLARTTKTCPGRPGEPCGWKIQKNKGCDHMTCSRCQGEFCWVCGAFYGAIREEGNGAHERSCRYHSDNLR